MRRLAGNALQRIDNRCIHLAQSNPLGIYMNKWLVSISLPLQILLVAALTFYFGNLGEADVFLSDALLPLVVLFFACVVCVYAILSMIGKWDAVYTLASGVFVGLAICVWMQSQLLVWDFGPLDGRGMDWGAWKMHGYGEVIAWCVVLSIVVFSFYAKNALAKTLPMLVVVLGLLSIASSIIFPPAPKKEKVAAAASSVRKERVVKPLIKKNKKMATGGEGVFEFDKNKNVVVLLLDTFQSDYFEKIVKDYPGEVEFLDGFTFYRNALASYPTTAPNIPAIFTGVRYENEMDFRDFVEDAYADKGWLSDIGYDFSLVGISRVLPGAVDALASLRGDVGYKIESVAKLVDYGFFKSFPIFLKDVIYGEGDWFLSEKLNENYPRGYHGKDARFLDLFEKKAKINPELNGKFLFFHFATPHPPWRVNENLQHDPSLQGAAGYERQGRGGLTIARRVLSKMKSLGIYDSSEIVIMSDHGTASIPALMGEHDLDFEGVPSSVKSSSLALLLHKKPLEASKGIRIDDSPVYNKDLACILVSISARNEEECEDVSLALKGGERQRSFYFYEWKHENWQTAFMPPMTEYILDGHAYDSKAWRHGRFIYDGGEKKEVPSFSVDYNDPVVFSNVGESSKITRFGWSGQESVHRWTDGGRAGLLVFPKAHAAKDIKLTLELGPYLSKGVNYQRVDLMVNGEYVETWRVNKPGKYSAIIPSSIIESGRLEVLLEIDSPASPCKQGESNDCRQLGVAARELVINPASPAEVAEREARRIAVGEAIKFSAKGRSSMIVRDGWSDQEENHRWTDGPKAAIFLELKKPPVRDIELNFDLAPYVNKDVSRQAVDVFANGVQVDSWDVSERARYKVRIPKKIFNGRPILDLAFNINHPASPCEFGESKDCRKLGVAALDLIVSEAPDSP